MERTFALRLSDGHLDVLEAERHTRESLEVALDRAIGDGDVDAIVELRRAQRILDGGVDIAAKSQAAWDAAIAGIRS